MFVNNTPLASRCLSVAAAAAFGLALTAAAQAQPGYGRYDNDPDTVGGVTVTAPRFHDRDSATGAPIEWVSTSRAVRYGDLDLSRPWGARELRARITRAARSACDELDSAYPLTAADSPPCVRNAIRQAMYNVPGGY
jgi:UrcA family protein